ncbi:MAG: tetratricopeptide repeat protein [Bacteroidales bacterium]|nr:tetratricopeptide repeat protein [Bacteroidales bacterium]
MKKITLIFISLVVTGYSLTAQVSGYRDALRLYEKGMFARSRMIFDRIESQTERKADPAGYSLLCDVRANVPGYVNRIEAFVEEYPYSVLIPQVRFYHALNLFDQGHYKEASEQFDMISENSLYRDQRTEFVFKGAYCNLENGNIYSARDGFSDVESGRMSDYTAPSRYALGYIEYNLKNFDKAISWFEKASQDVRFKEMSEYYVMECRFLLKDYDYVINQGGELFKTSSEERKPHLARIISESYLVRDDVSNARKFYDLSLAGGKTEGNRADWFYGGSVLYAVKDYEGAIDNFTRMGERCDSIGQIASYNLGFSYIQTKDKVAAMEAFKEASQLHYDDEIAEDALFNYAKLAFDLNSDISVFNEYLYRYSDARKGDRIYSYIALAALQNRDYEGAVEAYDKIDELDEDMLLNYMKANYLRANQLIGSGSYRKAVPCLKAAAYYSPKSSRFNQMSRFWLAEAYYRTEKYEDARKLFTELYNSSALYGQAESYLIPYNIAYCYFKAGNYSLAKKWFGEYLGEKSVKFRKEALVRKADCDFVTKNYKSAAAAYDIVLRDYFSVNDIYPYYQAALSYGLVNNHEKKIDLLSNVMHATETAEFYPEALFELGRSYAVKEDDENALNCFRKVTQSVKDSTYVAMAYVEMGTLARNQSMYNEALGYYKTVVEQMPLSEYADDALLAIESIYQTKNDVSGYLAYIDSIGKGGIKTEDEKENMIFNSAEQVFLSENYQKALVALQSYIDKYPQGRNLYKADFYMAESYRMLGMNEQACDSYKLVIDSGEGSFVELSMLNFSRLSYMLERWDDAYGGYASLYETAKLDNNTYVALLGMMRSAFKGHQWDKAIENADRLIADDRSVHDRTEAQFVKARSYLASSRRSEALAILEELSKDVSGSYGAEAAYILIQDSYDRGEFEQVEQRVYAFSDAGSGQTYWLAKSFIVLGDSFMERDEVEQAQATFESVRDGYVPSSEGDDVLDNVKMRLARIEQMSKTE